jgi:hypothetical protein
VTVTIKDYAGNPVAVTTPPDNGRAAAAISRPVTLSTEDLAVLTTHSTLLTSIAGYLDTVEALLAAATPAGAALIGKVGIDQTTDGLTNRVSIPALRLSSASTQSNVTAAASSTLLLAANASRIGGSIVNESTSVLYIKLSSGASATSYEYYLAGSVGGVPAQMEIPQGWTGVIYGFWVSANGAARIGERI